MRMKKIKNKMGAYKYLHIQNKYMQLQTYYLLIKIKYDIIILIVVTVKTISKGSYMDECKL